MQDLIRSGPKSGPALRIGLSLAVLLVVLLAVGAIFRPEMMHMAALRNLIVGFGL